MQGRYATLPARSGRAPVVPATPRSTARSRAGSTPLTLTRRPSVPLVAPSPAVVVTDALLPAAAPPPPCLPLAAASAQPCFDHSNDSDEDAVGAASSAAPLAGDGAAEKIRVFVRVRPLSTKEAREGQRVCVSVAQDRRRIVLCAGTAMEKTFVFDRVFSSEEHSQDDVFRAIARPLADAALNGYNGSIFA
jgi:hypothetical protein